MANVRLIAVNATGGAAVTVLASTASRRVEAIEDESVPPQGLVYQSKKDAFVTSNTVGPSTEPIILEDSVAKGRGAGQLQGLPQQSTSGAFNFQSATSLFTFVSLNLATIVRITEDD